MATPIPFIGRVEELQKIEGLIKEWDTCRVLCIHGEGGVGKTRLLEEIHKQPGQHSDAPLLVAQIIDFDDRTLHVVENIERQIMRNLSAEAFDIYSQQLHDWYKMKVADVSAEALAEKDQQVRQTVVDNFNHLSEKRRVVLLMDTLEKLEATNAWRRLTDLILQARNALFILAGRNTKELYESLRHDFSQIKADLIELGPLEPVSSQEYLAEKQRQLRITLDKTQAENLLLLTHGKPILIDLAAEWLSRNIPLDWVTAKSQPKNLTKAKLKKRQQDFQVQLVAHIGQIRTQMDRLILLMARVYPVDAPLIAKALNLTNDEAEALLNQAKTYVFVKSYPSGQQIYLHDEMRRMIRNYVWSEIDPDGERRQLDSQFAVTYLTSQVETLAQEIKQSAIQEEKADQEDTAQAEFTAFVKRQALEQELWAVREQLLFHTLFINPAEGINLFTEIFDQATREYQYSFREILLEQIRGYNRLTKREKYLKPLSPAQIYEADIREAKFLLDSGQYDKAERLLRSLLDREGLQPGQQVDTNIQIANVVLRLGRFDESIRFFQEAVNISKSNKLQNWLVKAENGLGWAYRHTANREKAREHYETALAIARELKLKHEQALLYSNLGFIYAYIPSERQKASSFCKASLRLWEELDDKRGKGRAYSTLGCVTFMEGQLEEALPYFQQALNIFEPVNDREWLSTVYSWRGAVCMSTNELDLAEKDLLQSLKMDIKKDRPMNLSRLGLVYLMQGKLKKGQAAVEECRALAVELRDVLYQMVSIRDLARLARQKKQFSQLETLESYLKDYLAEWGVPQDRRAFGMLYLEFGNLALGQGNIDAAISYYKQGLEPLARLGRYGSDSVEVHIRRLEEIFVTELGVQAEQIRSIGAALQSFWQAKGFDLDYPNVAIDLEKWATWEGV
jgi:tetratricopeptide (TPR) repeat protein